MKKSIMKFAGLIIICISIIIIGSSLTDFNLLGMLLGFVLLIPGMVLFILFGENKSEDIMQPDQSPSSQAQVKSADNNDNNVKYIDKKPLIQTQQIKKVENEIELIQPQQSELISCKTENRNDNADVQTLPSEDKKEQITHQNLDISEVLKRYLSHAHYSVPAKYDYYTYKKAEFDCIFANLQKVEITLNNRKVLRQKTSILNYTKSKNITSNTNLNKIKDFIAIDTETTGLKTAYNDIIEISAIKFIDFKPTELFTTLLKPRRPIPIEATNINGITNEMVADAPQFSQIYDSLENFLGKYPIVMHNAPFDLKFLCVSGLVIDCEKRTIFDTLELSRRCIKDYNGEPLENYKLATVCKEQCIFINGAHRSTADALATGLLFNEIILIKKDISKLTI